MRVFGHTVFDACVWLCVHYFRTRVVLGRFHCVRTGVAVARCLVLLLAHLACAWFRVVSFCKVSRWYFLIQTLLKYHINMSIVSSSFSLVSSSYLNRVFVCASPFTLIDMCMSALVVYIDCMRALDHHEPLSSCAYKSCLTCSICFGIRITSQHVIFVSSTHSFHCIRSICNIWRIAKICCICGACLPWACSHKLLCVSVPWVASASEL